MAEASTIENLYETLKCIICLDFAEEAVETTCCHQLGCFDCMKPLQKCPTCQKSDIVIQPGVLARRMIASMPAKCPFEKCGKNTTRGELKDHLKTCTAKAEVVCPVKECDFKGKVEATAAHIVQKHHEVTVCRIAASIAKNAAKSAICFFPSCKVRIGKEQFWNHVNEQHREDASFLKDKTSLCVVSTKEPVQLKNCAGFPVKMGKNGKFYCDRQKMVDESHCKHLGNNCADCMKLDVIFRDLAPFQLVNIEGRVCKTDPCNHCVGGYFEGMKSVVGRMCQKKTCGKDPSFYCSRVRYTYEQTFVGFVDGRNAYTVKDVTMYCKPGDEICGACRNISRLMMDPHLFYNTVWE